MNKIKLITPILGLSALVSIAIPITASCSKTVSDKKTTPNEFLKISGCTLEGIVEEKKLTDYNELIIPEGIKYINDDCFNVPSFDYSTIKTIVLPSSLREVGQKAFKGLNKLTCIDVSNMTCDTIIYNTFKDQVFGLKDSNNGRYCEVKLPSNINMYQKEMICKKLTDAGIPDWWFASFTNNHIDCTKDTHKEQNAHYTSDTFTIYKKPMAVAINSFTLPQPIDDSKFKLEFYAHKTASTDNTDDVIMDNDNVVVNDGMFVQVPAKFEGGVEKEGHEINYDINIVCRKKVDNDQSTKGEIVWLQKIEGFKITYVYTYVTGMKIQTQNIWEQWVDAQSFELTLPNKTSSIKTPARAQVLPLNAVNQNVTYDSDKKIAEYEEGILKPIDFGTTILKATSQENISISTQVNIDVNNALINMNKDDNFDSQVYTIPATGTIYYNSTLLGEEETTTGPSVYKPDYTRTIKLIDEQSNPINFDDTSIEVIRTEGKDLKKIVLEKEKHYTIKDNNTIELTKGTENGFTFKKGDYLVIKFTLKNENPVKGKLSFTAAN